MATIKNKHIGDQQFGGFTPYGNLTTLRATLLTLAFGRTTGRFPAAATTLSAVVCPGLNVNFFSRST